MSGSVVNTLLCNIDIYPYEGGQFQITSMIGLLRSCRVKTSLNDVNSGTFEIVLAPGGPYGPDSSPQWKDIIRPMSLIVIAMARGQWAHTVLVGVVRGIVENVGWQVGQSVNREVHVLGQDFSYIFSMANFFGSLLFQFSAGALISGGSPEGALSAVLSLGVSNTHIQDAAKAWFNKIMAGQGGLLQHMNFVYNGYRVMFNDLMATAFGSYPNLSIDIPVAQNYAIMGGTWWETFTALYAQPWFEFFITTAESGIYGQMDAAQPVQSSVGQVFAPVSPCLVGRPTPIPVLTNPTGTLGIDMSLWNALPVNTLETIQPLSSTYEFDESQAYNLYAVAPTYLGALYGAGNDNIASFVQYFGIWADFASIERYGYRPFVSNPAWMPDPTGDFARTVANSGGTNVLAEVVGTLTLKAASCYEPLPLMASGAVVTNLRPDIRMGTRLQVSVGKNLEPWMFYINGVEHAFSFGGNSLTTLSVCRGLPVSVYNNQTLMTDILRGNAMVLNGTYQSGLPAGAGQPLQHLNAGDQGLVAQLSTAFGQPGQK